LTAKSGEAYACAAAGRGFVRARHREVDDMKRSLVALIAVLGLAGGSARADVTVSDCTGDPHIKQIGKSTVVDGGGDNVILACHLVPLGKTSRIRISGATITVQGPAGGVSAGGVGKAVLLLATDEIVIDKATLEATNGNGSIQLLARNGLTITSAVLVTGSSDRAGKDLRIQCTAPHCPLHITKSNILGHIVRVSIQGNITSALNTIVTRGGRDLVDIRSIAGDTQLCCDNMGGGNESTTFISSFGAIDLQSTEINRAEGITVTSGLGGTGDTNLLKATLDNDFGKRGEIVVTAANGNGTVNIQDATLIDDDTKGPDVSTINGREQLPHQGHNNTVGTPATDD
jgi:hypothetical protein